MAGIYLHIPFCKRICHYCDFYKVGSLQLKESFIEALLKEIVMRKDTLTAPVETIYLGGGTPSVLSKEELERIFKVVKDNYNVLDDAEITVEVNPDDVSEKYYGDILKVGVNRLSIGVQSFNDTILKFLNRRHNAQVAYDSIEYAKIAGFKNISVDLIYGIPSQTVTDFVADLSEVIRFRVPHLSAYHLGIEEGTYFGKLKSQNRFHEIDEGLSELFYDTLTDWADENFFDHYELSNFAFNERFSKHNKNYWFHVPYLSFGPSAHSFINNIRYHNVSNLKQYITCIEEGKEFTTVEQLTEVNRFNEFVMLRLRTMWGLDLNEVAMLFGAEYMAHLLTVYSKFEDSGYISVQGDNLALTREGFFVSDYMFKEFFIHA
ncbi:MAG: radical SAM family heme chaperone HemW [Chloroflexia bacterium]|nr:radical SAM family heme chaperone HemW [Chloroflexia bacterium]